MQPRMKTLTACLLLAAGLSQVSIADAEAAGPSNMSSHGAQFFRELLTGRVYVFHLPAVRSAATGGALRGAYFLSRDEVVYCARNSWSGDYEWISYLWRVVYKNHARFNVYKAGTKPDPKLVKGHFPMFYDHETGALDMESFIPSTRMWLHYRGGHVQETWPRALKNACPDLDLPGDLAINERQTSRTWHAFQAQDPDAPIRNFAGSHLRVLGARGFTKNTPLVTEDQIRAWVRANDGTIVRNTWGVPRVLVAGRGAERKNEIWKLGWSGEGEVVDTAYASKAANGQEIHLKWESEARVYRYRIGYPLGYAPTGQRFAAFLLSDWMVSQDREIGLPFLGRENVGFRFAADGTLSARTVGDKTIRGIWQWSRGMLNIRLDGIEEVETFRWRALAHRLGWTPPVRSRGQR